jgi:hypothetical protein
MRSSWGKRSESRLTRTPALIERTGTATGVRGGSGDSPLGGRRARPSPTHIHLVHDDRQIPSAGMVRAHAPTSKEDRDDQRHEARPARNRLTAASAIADLSKSRLKGGRCGRF